MSGRLQGRVAIVTGAGRGIGRAEAIFLAREGVHVLVNNRSKDTADDVVTEIQATGGDAVANYGLVESMEAGEQMVQQALDQWGRLDILVNNAGFADGNMTFNMTEEQWDSVLAADLKGHFTITRYAAKVFCKQRSGRLIGTSSRAGLGLMGLANYSAAKEGIVGFFRALARDVGRFGVTANVIRPRAATRANAHIAKHNHPDQDPERVAQLVAWLCTDAAANVNGQDFLVSGNTISLFSQPTPTSTIYRAGGWTLDTLDEVFPSALSSAVNKLGPQIWEPTDSERANAEFYGYGFDPI